MGCLMMKLMSLKMKMRLVRPMSLKSNQLVSQVEIEDDPEELEKQINVAGVESNNMSQMYVL